MQKTLFNEKDFSDVKTQGIKYAGSKLKIIPYILESIKDLEIKTILDGFSGSTRVSQAFAQAGYNVVSNDISHWSEVCAKCFLLHNKDKKYYQDIINDLNVYRADLTDSSAVDNIISKVKPEYIYHLAAYGTFSFQKDCDKMIQTNSLGTLNLLNACRRLGFSGFCDERGSGVKIFNQNEKAHSLEIFN